VDAALAVVAIGLGVGAASTLTGLGAGLALPALALAGFPMPAALLATKLPVAVADVLAAAASGARERIGTARAAGLAGAGAAGIAAVIVLPGAFATALLAAALGTALLSDSIARRAGAIETLWALYVGGFGAGTVLLRSLGARRNGEDSGDALARTRRLGALANAGALAVLLLYEGSPGATLCLLAAAQGAGAGVAALARRAWVASRGHRPPRRARGAANQAGMRTGSCAYPRTKFDGTRTGSPTTSTTG